MTDIVNPDVTVIRLGLKERGGISAAVRSGTDVVGVLKVLRAKRCADFFSA
jgi:hypothetical protein